MSRSVDLFIDADASIDDLAAKLGQLLGKPLAQAPDPAGDGFGPHRWTLQEGDVEATLTEHPYVDDGELLLSQYRYVVSAKVAEAVRLQDARETALLRSVADKVLRESGERVLLVLDLQYRDRPGPAGRARPVTSLAAAHGDVAEHTPAQGSGQ